MSCRCEFKRRAGVELLACLAACLGLLCLSGSAYAAAAGRIVFAAGAPQAVDTSGIARVLKRGDDVFSGDRLTTDQQARVQISFVDGAYISLRPNSEYEIELYQYAGRPDGTERASYRLLRGGVRALTGLIGKDNPEAYKVNTPVATIGIRGTGHNTRLCQGGDCPGAADGLYHNTWEGTTYVVNDVSSVDVPTGKGVYVEALDRPIIFLDQAPGVTAVETGEQRQEEQEEEEDRVNRFVAGDQRDEQGDQE
ncbi:MAG: FecR domain-containing protein, partial [Gammaproteobacteria bacterium]|nr:FecR domain-containing protein [Gammaproteobacteria bacterium]